MKERGNIKSTSIDGLLLIERPTFGDERGFFHEVVRINELLETSGVDFKPVQINHAMSLPKVIRGIHTEEWNKVIYPITGKIFSAIVDVRPQSPTFGKYESFVFDNTDPEGSHAALFLPKGMGNSVCVMGIEPVHYIYAVDEYWDNDKAKGIAWDDPDINIDWPIKNPIVSERDRQNPRLRDLYPDKFK